MRTAIDQIVSIYTGQHNVTKLHLSCHTGNIDGFRRVKTHVLFGRVALRHGAETATSRAKVAKDHESCRTAMKTFVDIRAARRFANRVKIARPQARLQLV
jgi:hypothetical protein